MIGWGITAGIILIILAFIMSSYIHCHLYINRVQDRDQISVQFKALYGWIKLRYDIPMLQFMNLSEGVKVELGEQNKHMPIGDHHKKNNIDWDAIAGAYDRVMHVIHRVNGYFHWLKQTLRKLHVTEFNWYTRVGAGDAPQTAMLSGTIWALKGTLSGWLFHHVTLDKTPQFSVMPMYNRTLFSTELACITKIRTGNAIIAGLKLLARMRLEKGGFGRWQSIRFKG